MLMKYAFYIYGNLCRFLSVSVLLSFVLLFVSSCSVKEDRSVCPCCMTLDFSELCDMGINEVVVRVATPDGLVFSEKVGCEYFKEDYVRTVPRRPLTVSVWTGADVDGEVEELLKIPYGMECPPLYMDVLPIDATGESCFGKVQLNKNHCRLTVRMKGNDVVPYSLTFRGGIDGYGYDGTLSEGGFCSVAYPEENGALQTVLPRQADSSLMMELDDGKGFFKTFAIGEYMAAGGYDWAAESLLDAEVTLDYYVTHIQISVQGWDAEYDYTVIL